MKITSTRFTTQARTWLATAGLTALLIGIGAFVGGAFLYLVAGLAVASTIVGYRLSDRLALKASRVKPVARGTNPELEVMVQDLAQRDVSGAMEKAILAGGCFWGMQDLFRRRPGVVSTRVGYTGGDVSNATYRNHGTHAEAIEIVFDPKKTSYRDLLEFFFQIHDPTTPNRQGNDVGTSYRSAIFYGDEEQRRVAEETVADVDASGLWPGSVVTEVTPAGAFWEAEPEHQDYLERYPNGYTCHFPRRNWVLPRRAEAAAG